MDNSTLQIIKMQRAKAANRKRRPPSVSTWTHRERYGSALINSFNIVMVTRGCRWYRASGCSMCGYSNDSSLGEEDIQLEEQLEKVKQRYTDEPLVKVFTSGSFFDEQELKPEERMEVLTTIKEMLSGKKATLVVESRPQFITEDILADTQGLLGDVRLTVAIGLESSNDRILKESINKGFTFEDYKEAAKKIVTAGATVKTYLMLKPPFLSEQDALQDCIDSIRDVSALGYPQTISINPMNIQGFTLVEHLFRRGEYRSPWLWTVVEVLRRGKEMMGNDSWLLCHPTAGGKSRGVHNCPDCNAEFLEAIQDFCLTNDVSALDNLACDCEKEYRTYLLDYK